MQDRDEGLKKKRERSPSFPYLDIDTAIDLAEKLYLNAKMSEVRSVDLASAWNMSPKSGSLMRYIAALGQYGLLDASGGGDERRYKVSLSARRIFEDDRPGVREKLVSEAALKPKVIRDLFLGDGDAPKWGNDRPSDSIAESILKFDLHFTQEAAKRFLSIYDAATSSVGGGVMKSSDQPGYEEYENNKEGAQIHQDYEGPVSDAQSSEQEKSDTASQSSSELFTRTRDRVTDDLPLKEWFRAKVGKEKTVAVYYSGAEEIGSREISKLIALLEAQKIALED